MVRVVDVDGVDFRTISKTKKVVCFGLGKQLDRFIKCYPDLEISGVIDNYKYEEVQYLQKTGKHIPVWPPDEFQRHIDSDTMIVITSSAVEEMIDQLDVIEEADGMDCFAEPLLTKHEKIGMEQKGDLLERITCLSHRTLESMIKERYGEGNQRDGQKKYQIWEYIETGNTAASKAREDIRDIVGKMGYEILKVHRSRGIAGTSIGACSDRMVEKEWIRHFEKIPENSFLLIQGPTGTRLPETVLWRMKEEKQIRMIYVIHDIEVLRKSGSAEIRDDEFRIINEVGDIFIVHNDTMKQFYVDLGIDERRVISLQVFDYLSSEQNTEKLFEKSISIAGNLSPAKSGYLEQLHKLDFVKIHLYGPGLPEGLVNGVENLVYHGSVPSNLIPKKLDRGFGLVWDGERIDTCSGNTGQYLRYNNPHKLSLYLSAGLPVIIWNEAAESRFVTEHQVGFAIRSLYELEERLSGMTEKEYLEFVRHAERLSEMLRAGMYTTAAVKRAEELL